MRINSVVLIIVSVATLACSPAASRSPVAQAQAAETAPTPPPSSKKQASVEMVSYTNGRFGFSVQRPKNFKPLRSPDNGGGQAFAGPGGAELRVWGSYNSLDQTVEQAYSEAKATRARSGEVTYAAQKDNWYVLSGFEGDGVFYEKFILADGQITGLEMTYPRSKKATYDPIVGRVAKSLTPPRGE